MSFEKTDSRGTWVSDDGLAWALASPSQDRIDEMESIRLRNEGEVRPPSREESAALAARLAVVDKVRADELDDDTVSQLVALFPPLADGLDVKAGEVYSWDGTLVEVIQDHTTQQDWIDAMDPSLFKVHRAYGVVTDWVQPTGSTDAYQTGEAVRYEGNIYTSLIDANTTVPGSDDRWWELVD